MGLKKEQSTKTGAQLPSMTTPLLDIAAVAETLGTSRRHVQRLVAERRIPFVKVGRFVRFDPAALEAWIDTRRVDPVQRPARFDRPWR